MTNRPFSYVTCTTLNNGDLKIHYSTDISRVFFIITFCFKKFIASHLVWCGMTGFLIKAVILRINDIALSSFIRGTISNSDLKSGFRRIKNRVSSELQTVTFISIYLNWRNMSFFYQNCEKAIRWVVLMKSFIFESGEGNVIKWLLVLLKSTIYI